MPTITTTVDSGTGFNTTFTAKSAGDVATTATTSGADQLPQGPSHFHGFLLTVQTFEFQNPDDKATFVVNLQPMFAASRNHGHPGNFGYVIDTGALTFTCIMGWDGAASFLQTEALFAANSAIQSLIGNFTAEANFCGDIDESVQAKIDLWNQAPGFDIYAHECDFIGKTINKGLTSDGFGLVRTGSFATKEATDDMFAKFRFMASGMNDCFQTNVVMRTSDTSYIGLWLSDSPRGLADWINYLKHPDVAPILGETLANQTAMGGHWFGNTSHEPSKALMAAWPMFPAAPMLGGSLGGANICSIQRWSYATKASRDAMLRVMDNLRGFQGESVWCGWPAGDVGMYVLIASASIATSREMQAVIGGSAEVMEQLQSTDLVNLSHYDFGNIQAEWTSDIAGWREAIPALRPDPNANLICCVDAGANANFHSDGVTWVQECVYNNAGDPEKIADLFSSGELYEKGREVGMSYHIQKLGPTRATCLFNFPSDKAWLEFNTTLAKHAAVFTEVFKDLQCYGVGNVHGAAVAASAAEWNKAPWCNVMLVARVAGIFGPTAFPVSNPSTPAKTNL